MNLKDKKIAIYTHNSGGTGNYDDELYSFLIKNSCRNILKVDFPFGQKSVKSIRVKEFKDGRTVKDYQSFIKFSTPILISYFKDFVYGMIFGFFSLRKTDLFFGIDNLLVFVGILFKRIGYVKRVAYVVYDYTPRRYNNKLLNLIYCNLDRFCLYNSDFVLPLNKEMIEGRIKDRDLDGSKINYIVCPFGNNSLAPIGGMTTDNYESRKIVYFGQVTKDKGAELFVPIVKSLLEKNFIDFKLVVIGGGDTEYLKTEVAKNNLDLYFNILGRVNDVEKIEKELRSCSLALAPYYPEDMNNFSYYADPGKVKFYLGCGLPIIITAVPPIAKVLESNGSGIISRYDAEEYSMHISDLLSNRLEYLKFRDRAIIFGKEFDWNIIFANLFNRI